MYYVYVLGKHWNQLFKMSSMMEEGITELEAAPLEDFVWCWWK